MKKNIILMVLAIACTLLETTAQYIYPPNEFQTTGSAQLRHQFDIYLGHKNHLQLELSTMTLLPGLLQMDSILRAALQDIAAVPDSIAEGTESRKIEIYTDSLDIKTMRIKDIPGEKTFMFSKEELLLLKVAQDTLVIGKTFRHSTRLMKAEPEAWKITLVINNIEDISNYTNGALDSVMQQVNNEFAKSSGWNPGNDRKTTVVARYMTGSANTSTSSYQHRRINFNLSIFGEVVLQNINQGFSPSFVFPGAGIYYEKYGIKNMFDITLETFLAFNRNNAGSIVLQPNTFLNINFTRKPLNNAVHLPNWGYPFRNLSLGLLVDRKGDMFEKNTFRLRLHALEYKSLTVSPQFFFHDLFKQVQPSLRIGLGF